MPLTVSTLPAVAADRLRELGEPDAHVSMLDELHSDELLPGDSCIALEVLRRLGRTRDWEWKRQQTVAEVVASLDGVTVDDAALQATFGPQWREVVDLVYAVAALTPDQAEALAHAVEADDPAVESPDYWARNTARNHAYKAPLVAAGHFGHYVDTQWPDDAADADPDARTVPMSHAARSAVREAVNTYVQPRIGATHPFLQPTGPSAAAYVMKDVVLAVAARDLIGQDGGCNDGPFTQEQYDALTRTWRRAIGPLHAADIEDDAMSSAPEEADPLLLSSIAAAHNKLVQAEAVAESARAHRDSLIRDAAEAGVTAYAIAKRLGVAASTVGRVIHRADDL